MKHFKDYLQLSEYMDRLGLFHMDLTLDRMRSFWEERGMPGLPVVHVVGTNGKGSTTSFFASLARAHGLKVGQFTSPHFLTPRERIMINRAMLSEEVWTDIGNEIMDTPGGEELTYFEFQTCLAMLAFEHAQVDVAVMEAGLGGRYDATTMFEPGLTLYAPIGMDHEKILGPTLVDIARDKAGAMHECGVAMTGPQAGEVMGVLEEEAQKAGARLVYAVDAAEPVNEFELGLKGLYQTVNARLALAGWRWYAADREIRSQRDLELFGLESAFMPGRFQFCDLNGMSLILDGAHNEHALKALRANLRAGDIHPDRLIFACLKDKTLDKMMPLVRELTDGPILVPTMHNERAMTGEKLAGLVGDRAVALDSMEEALNYESKGVKTTLICGSLYLLAEFYKLHPELLSPQLRICE